MESNKKKVQVPYLPHQRTSWIILTLLFIFDNLVSYWGIKYMHGIEGNLLIAPIVEKYPVLYFPIIPLTVFIMFVIVRIILKLCEKILKKWVINREILERIILAATVIYWAVTNSSMNLIFLLGYRVEISFLLYPTILGLSLSAMYAIYMLLITRKMMASK